MESAEDRFEPGETLPRATVSPGSALLLSAWFGLVGGYLDLGMIFLKRDVFHAVLYYEQGKNFRWAVPVANLVVMMVPGLLIAAVEPAAAGADLAAIGLPGIRHARDLGTAPEGAVLRGGDLDRGRRGRPHDQPRLARHDRGFRRFAMYSLIALLVLVGTTATVSYRRRSLAESGAVARLPAPPAGAENVLLIVMDTVRADSLGLYGYARDTTPHLARWAKRGVRFEWALAPAPWTFPSHSLVPDRAVALDVECALGTDPQPSLSHSGRVPRLARLSRPRGFAANTHWCSYESGMDRGFAHYEDYPLTPRTDPGQHRAGPLDPREPSAPPRLLQRQVDPIPVPGRRRGSTGRSWTGCRGSGTGAALLRLLELSRRTRALHCPGRRGGRQFGLRPGIAHATTRCSWNTGIGTSSSSASGTWSWPATPTTIASPPSIGRSGRCSMSSSVAKCSGTRS